MKKIIFHLCILLSILLPTHISWAEDCSQECTIFDGPAPILLDYIENSKKLLENLSSQTSGKAKSSAKDSQKDILRIYNYYVFNWDSYFTRFEYNVLLHLGNEIPKEMKRDYKLIQDEILYQNDFIYRLASSGHTSIEVSDICGDIPNCDLSGPAGDVAAQILANTNRLAHLFRLSVSGNYRQASTVKIGFGEGITQSIIDHYNKRMIAHCSACEGATLHTIWESIKNISLNSEGYKKGIQEWKDAWALLTGAKKQSNLEEQAALKKELKSQGFSQSNTDIFVENLKKYQEANQKDRGPTDNEQADVSQLEKYNNGGESFINNSFLVHSYNAVADSYAKIWEDFDEAIEGNFDDTENTQVTTINFNATQGDVGRSDEIKSIVQALYVSQLPYASTQDNSAQKTVERVILIHAQLTRAIENLAETIRFTEEACNEQHTGDGICSAGQ